MYERYIKRGLDVVLSGAALIVLSPILLVTTLAIRLEDGGPALFVQERVGRNGTRFRFLKFRSMPVDTATVPSAGAATLTITRVGRVIRRTNIDELPQLINILRGDMSVVGPRPAIATQEDLLRMRAENGSARCRPGLTGMAQVNSYDGMPDTEKAAYDGEYARNLSIATDISIIVRTFGYLLRPPPVY